MNIALGLQHRVVLALQALFQPAPRKRSAHARLEQPTPRQPATTPAPCRHIAALPARLAPACAPQLRAMPLRVRHVVEVGQARAQSGRLVISGRMADVCAELDRLAEREAALN